MIFQNSIFCLHMGAIVDTYIYFCTNLKMLMRRVAKQGEYGTCNSIYILFFINILIFEVNISQLSVIFSFHDKKYCVFLKMYQHQNEYNKLMEWQSTTTTFTMPRKTQCWEKTHINKMITLTKWSVFWILDKCRTLHTTLFNITRLLQTFPAKPINCWYKTCKI